jgi:hypothetical protein
VNDESFMEKCRRIVQEKEEECRNLIYKRGREAQ